MNLFWALSFSLYICFERYRFPYQFALEPTMLCFELLAKLHWKLELWSRRPILADLELNKYLIYKTRPQSVILHFVSMRSISRILLNHLWYAWHRLRRQPLSVLFVNPD